MKRDIDLIRKILFAIESEEHGYVYSNPEIDGYTREVVGYHVYLLKGAGLVVASDGPGMFNESPMATARALSWEGHEFLDASRKQEIWEQAKQVISETGSASLEIWKSVLTDLVKNSLNL